MSVKQDFQPPRSSATPRTGKTSSHRVIIGAVLVLIVISLIAFFSFRPSSDNDNLSRVDTSAAVVKEAAVQPPSPPEPVREEIVNVVPAGSSITALLGDYFTAQEIYSLNQQSRDVFPFTKICAGRPYKIITVDGKFKSFIYEIDDKDLLVINRNGDETTIERQEIVYDVTTELVQGTIHSSLLEAVHDIGEDHRLAFILADIFAWDIDFIRDLRVGDTFQALVEKRFRDGKPAGYGKVIAAEFVNQQKVFKAIRFKDGDQPVSYYNEKGENLRKAFLKAPLAFSRISSGFTMHRFHPILKTWKAHPAIDYVAPVGTPIKTVGDGTIYRIGYSKGNGNFIEVRHSNGYSTLYLHMKGFARRLHKGSRVTQGQVIGYLGGTGMATGPHLCFRMRLNGRPVNPTKLKVPAAKSVSKAHLAEFKALATPLIARLDKSRNQQHVAKLDKEHVERTMEKTQ